VAAAEAVVVAAEAAGLRVFVGHLLLYHPAVRKMLELIHAGRIGRVRHLRSRRLSWGRLRSQENVWWSFAPHDCAVMLAVMQDNPKSAIGVLRAFVRDNVGDFAYADFGFDNGRSAHIEVSWLDPDKSSRVDIFGSEGTLTLLDAREGATLSLTPCGDRSSESAGPELWRDEPQHIPLATGEPLRLELEAFCSAIRGEGEFPTEGREGLAVVRALAMIDNQSVPEHVGLAALA
jgi:UDP-2-acetamido-3-amino-2,3-dideoxy-glucuronate N-acetyltransferase